MLRGEIAEASGLVVSDDGAVLGLVLPDEVHFYDVTPLDDAG